ncbi:TspO/MBR family protein [Nocardia mangyaensis]|uniref:TspO/MBR family protein n=1 Tax=Nocardia mangyaensis TaxID=2213200 RepID=UPI000A06BAF4|nr:TspO/MBR family protein [Nocardia mangyaensis]
MSTIVRLIIAVVIVVISAAIGAVAAGDALSGWYRGLRQPAFGLPLWGWGVVGAIYYCAFTVVLFRLLGVTRAGREDPSRFVPLAVTLGIMLGNELWNVVLFGWHDLFLAFAVLWPFALYVALVARYVYRRADRIAGALLGGYAVWLVYDLAWMYGLWQLN